MRRVLGEVEQILRDSVRRCVVTHPTRSAIALITLIVVDRLQEDADRFQPIVVEISE